MSTQVEGLDTVTIGEGRSVGVWTGGPTADVNWGEGKLQMVFCCNVRGGPQIGSVEREKAENVSRKPTCEHQISSGILSTKYSYMCSY